jgi:hypothetical protein
VTTLPDARQEVPTEADIAAHENARREAAKVQISWEQDLSYPRELLKRINEDLSFGVSFSQQARNDRARQNCIQVANGFKSAANRYITKAESGNGAENVLTEADNHTISGILFLDVQLEDAMKGLGMAEDADLVLAMNRLKSLQKLYLFQQKGGDNYLEVSGVNAAASF